MKKAFKFMALALMAGALVVACSKDNDNDNSNPDPNPGQSSYSLTFGGQALDVSGYAQGVHGDTQSGHVWLFQAAKAATAEDGISEFPFIVAYYLGTSTSNAQVAEIELYKDTYLQDANGNMYGDWQLNEVNSLNCTAMDATTGVVSLVSNTSMFDLNAYSTNLNDLMEEGQETPTQEQMEQAMEDTPVQDMVLTLQNVTFTAVQK